MIHTKEGRPMIKIAVDGMGGDFAPEPIVKGTLAALDKFKNIEIIIFGDEQKNGTLFKKLMSA